MRDITSFCVWLLTRTSSADSSHTQAREYIFACDALSTELRTSFSICEGERSVFPSFRVRQKKHLAKPWKPLILPTTPAFRQQLCKNLTMLFPLLNSAIFLEKIVKRKDLLCVLWLCFWRTVVACRHGGRWPFFLLPNVDRVGVMDSWSWQKKIFFGLVSWNAVLVLAADAFSRH